MSSLLHLSASMAREIIKPQFFFQKLKTYSAPTVGNKVRDIKEHHRAITKREDTVSHHRLIGGNGPGRAVSPLITMQNPFRCKRKYYHPNSHRY